MQNFFTFFPFYVKRVPKLTSKIWICRHFCIKLLASLKKKQFDSWEFRIGNNGALYNNVS